MLLSDSHLLQAIDPVFDTQATYRVLLDAMARPGTVHQLPKAADQSLVNRYVATVLLTLCDIETSLAFEPFVGAGEMDHFIRQRVSPPVAHRASADFVVADGTVIDPDLPLALKRGSLAFPNDGATLIVFTDVLGKGETYQLEGPGCPPDSTFVISSVAPGFFESRNTAVSGYPVGIDLIFVDQAGRVAALPRTTSVTR